MHSETMSKENVTSVNYGLHQHFNGMNGLSYSKLMHGLKLAEIDINRKMLADLAVNDATAFTALAEQAKDALSK